MEIIKKYMKIVLGLLILILGLLITMNMNINELIKSDEYDKVAYIRKTADLIYTDKVEDTNKDKQTLKDAENYCRELDQKSNDIIKECSTIYDYNYKHKI